MSIIQDALRQAMLRQATAQAQQFPAVPSTEGPRLVQRPRSLDFTALLAMMTLGFVVFLVALQIDRRESQKRDAELSIRIEALDKKHEDFVKRIYTTEDFLDVRVQLDVIELRSRLDALTETPAQTPTDAV